VHKSLVREIITELFKLGVESKNIPVTRENKLLMLKHRLSTELAQAGPFGQLEDGRGTSTLSKGALSHQIGTRGGDPNHRGDKLQ
jgi:hypothetical protein